MFDLVIRGGTLVTACEQRRADLGIVGDKIVRLGEQLPEGRREIDASSLLVLPGGVDPHVHLSCADEPMDGTGRSWADDFETGSRAAFAGGITTVGNMSFVEPGELLSYGLERESQRVSAQALADVFVHPVLMEFNESSVQQARAVWESGQPSLKLFMSMPDFDAHLATVFRVMQAAAQANVVTLIHCEDAACIACSTHLLVQVGGRALRHYPASRPHVSELISVQRAIALCELTGCTTYIVHLSTAAALKACAGARARGLPLHVETRPMYLHMTQAAYARSDAGLYVGQPPLRTAADVEALWQGLFDGSIDTLGSDHAPFTRAQKLASDHDIVNVKPGVADLETMLPMLFSEGVKKRGLSLERFVALTSENAARLFGLYPRKGTLAEGSDADLVIWDPECVREVQGERMHSRAGYSIYDGTKVTGWPKLTLRRGDVVLGDDGDIRARAGSGQLLSRRRR